MGGGVTKGDAGVPVGISVAVMRLVTGGAKDNRASIKSSGSMTVNIASVVGGEYHTG
jgi:hypothetical protein